MWWAIDLDDFNGAHCGQGKYPLVSAVDSMLKGATPSTVPPTNAPPPPHTTYAPPDTQAPPPPPTTKSPPITEQPPPPTTPGGGSGGKCIASGVWAGNTQMDAWCVSNCAAGYCPSDICKCT